MDGTSSSSASPRGVFQAVGPQRRHVRFCAIGRRVDGDIVFVEIYWTGTKMDGTPLDERGVIVMGIRDNRLAWGRLYVDEVKREGTDIDAVVRRMAGTEER